MSDRPPSLVDGSRGLIVKPSSLGDVVSAVPVLRGLRRALPQAHLAWLLASGCAPLLSDDPDLDEVVLFDRRRLGRAWRSFAAAGDLRRFLHALRRAGYDWVIDLQGLLRSGLFAHATGAPLRVGFADAREGAGALYTHRIRPEAPHTIDRNLAVARALGVQASPEDLFLHVCDADRASVGAKFAAAGVTGPFVACVPPTRWPTKRYPVRHWRRVVAELVRRRPVVLLGAPGDRAAARAIVADQPAGLTDLTGQTTLPEFAAVLAAADGVVCCDSAAMFVAPAVGTDAVVLMGPTRLERTGPYRLGRAVVAPVACRGCLRRRCRHASCMELIDPARVVATAEAMLADAEVAEASRAPSR